ncbi:sigma-70 family RNA polymerase sigma factor [Candidatus Poribacteria bacterium]|nr:sigma-70 family RNA polymerase sigma factor [Candidatus Poribacteria bacterium]
MNNKNDYQIVKRIQANDSSAFTELVKKYQRMIHGLAYHKTQDLAAAEDITQEVFLDVYLHLHTLQNPGKLGAWLRKIALYKSVDWIRRNQELASVTEYLPAESASVLETLERNETYERLSSIIQNLSEPNRIVVTLRYMEGLSNSQIADFLEVSPSVVSTRLQRALKQLQEQMSTEFEMEFPKADFADAIFRKIAACRPLIGVGLQFSNDHRSKRHCTCARRAKALAKQMGGAYQEYPPTGLAIWYGMVRIREDDALKAVETALKLQSQSCPAGPFSLRVAQMLDKEIKNCPGFPFFLEAGKYHLQERDAGNSAATDIVVDSSIAFLLRYKFHFERIPHFGGLSNAGRLTLNPLPTSIPGGREGNPDILVGRHAEMAQLEDAVAYLLVGGAGIIRLTGEAGVGKTHLLRALRKRCEGKSVIWLEGKANIAKPYQPICEAIQAHFGFQSADALKEHLASLGLETALPYFANLLNLPFKSTDKKFNTLSFEQISYHTFQRLRDWLTQLTEVAPVVWVVDDTHWLSPEDSRLLQYLCRTTKDSPVLFLFARRAGYEQVAEAEHGLELERQVAQRYPEVYQQINLEPLSEESSRYLLSHFLGTRKLLPSDLDRVLSLAAGNPLYLREVAQFLNVANQLSLPPGVERLILAHLELLPPVQQSLLRYASVLGSRVDVALLQAAFQIEPQAIEAQFQQIGWLQPATGAWRHDLYRESIYNSIESNARQQLHAEIAQQLEGRPETSPDVLAEHFSAAGNPEKAAHYACLATVMCHQQRQHRRVQRYAKIALAHPSTLSQEQQVEIRLQYAEALHETGRPLEAIPYLEEALRLAHTNDQRILIHIKLADCCENRDRERALRETALSLIDSSTEASVLREACQMFPWRIKRTPNSDVVRRVLHLAQQRKDSEAEAMALSLLAHAQAAVGNLDDAKSTIQHAIQLAEMLGDNKLLAEMEFRAGITLYDVERAQEAITHLHRAQQLLEQIGENTCFVWMSLGASYRRLEQYEAMTEAIEKAQEQAVLLEDVSKWSSFAFASLVHGYAYLGDFQKAYHSFWQMVDHFQQIVDSVPYPTDWFYEVEAAIGALCYGDRTEHRWIWEDIPQTMARAQELIRQFYEHRITAEENKKRFGKLHPVLAAGYVEYGVKRSHEEGVAMMRLFARQVWILDEHVEFWAYLSGIFDADTLEAIFADALEQVEREGPIPLAAKYNNPEFLLSAHPEKLILQWLRACLRERYETADVGKHLRQMGIIPEPCWLIIGTFEEHVLAEVEQMILNIVFNRGKRDQMTLENREASESDNLQSSIFNLQLDWRTTDDFRDGYIDCRHIFQTMARVSAYACTTIHSPREQQVQFTLYHDDKCRIWLNGEPRFSFEKNCCAYSRFDGVLQQGDNLVLIRLTNIMDGWGFILRVTDLTGEPLDDLTYRQPPL